MAITSDAVSQTATRIAEHVKTHELGRVEIVLHGGEPLLAGVAGLRAILIELERTLGDLCRPDVKVHTNGVLLNKDFCELFDEHGVGVGISLDGDRAANDRHRNYREGRSSYDAVIRAIATRQHGIADLSAACRQCPVVTSCGGGMYAHRYPAPWRKDPRPLEGLLQGTYAHLAVSEFWRVRAGLGESDQAEAAKRYEHWRAHTAAGIETLANSDLLAPPGMRFASQMRIAIVAHGPRP